MTRQPRRFVGHFYKVFKGQAQFGARGQCAADFPRVMTGVFDLTWAEYDSLMNYNHKTLRNAHREHASANTKKIIDALVIEM